MNSSDPRCRVVVIDDNRGFRIAAEAFLRTLNGVEFAGTAPDGEQGIELVARLRPDAAILDISMPGMNGFEVATRLRAQTDAPGIILVSMNVDQATRTEAHQLGVDGVVAKADLVEQLPRLLEAISLKNDRRGNARTPGNGEGHS